MKLREFGLKEAPPCSSGTPVPRGSRAAGSRVPPRGTWGWSVPQRGIGGFVLFAASSPRPGGPAPTTWNPGSEAGWAEVFFLGLGAGAGQVSWGSSGERGLGGPSAPSTAGRLGGGWADWSPPSPWGALIVRPSCQWERPVGLCIKTSAEPAFRELSEMSLVS